MQETSKDKSVLKVPSLQSLSAQIVKKTATEETALKLLHLAVIYQAKELEEGCLSLIMLCDKNVCFRFFIIIVF